MLTIAPPRPLSRMAAIACLQPQNVPVRCVATRSSQSSFVVSCSRPSPRMPALLTMKSSAPYSATQRSIAATTSSSCRTSPWRKTASPPSDLDSSTAAWPASAFRARATTRAPSATASSRISRPRPLEVPVTTPALPASRTLCLRLDLVQELFARDDRVGEVVVHPGKVLPAGLDDAQRVPGWDVLLVDVLGHELRVDLVDVVETHDDRVCDALRVRWSLGREAKAEHS